MTYPSDRQADGDIFLQDNLGQENTAIIATTEPLAFEERFARQLNRSVFVCDNSEDALAVFASKTVDVFFAEFRQLNDKWTGQRFLRHIRQDPQYANTAFYLMANSWFEGQEQWAVRCGAMGFVKRSPDALAPYILGRDVAAKSPDPAGLDTIDAVFGAFAGPMRRILIEETRTAFTQGLMERTLESYIADLSMRLANNDRRKEFVEAAKAALPEQGQ